MMMRCNKKEENVDLERAFEGWQECFEISSKWQRMIFQRKVDLWKVQISRGRDYFFSASEGKKRRLFVVSRAPSLE